MLYFDIVIVILIIWFGYKGFSKGFIKTLATLLAFILGVWGCINFSVYTSTYLNEAFQISSNLLPIISFSITFLIILLVVNLLATILEKIVKLVALGFINKIAGAFFSILKILLIISVILNYINNLNQSVNFLKQESIDKSYFYRPISSLTSFILPKIEEIKLKNFSTEFQR